MWGLFFIVFFCIGAFIHSCKNDIENTKSKQNAINNNQKYYLDWRGSKRRVDNNHKVLQHVTDYRTGDKVDLDMKTNEVLRNYSQEERTQENQEEHKWEEENRKAKEKAIKEGWYSYYAKVRTRPGYSRVVPYEYVDKRVSDDLLVKDEKVQNDAFIITAIGSRERSVCVDCDYKFRLYEHSQRARNNRDVLRDDDKYNKWLCKYLVKQNKTNMTEEQLLAYAKKIGAIFIGEEKTDE